MALNRLLGRRAPPKTDPVIWVKRPMQRLGSMPPHMAKEGALLLMEAGAPAYQALREMAGRPVQFSMQDAIDLSEARSAALDQQRRAERLVSERPTPHAASQPDEPEEEEIDASADRAVSDRRPLPGMKSFAVRRHDTMTGKILIALASEGGQGRFTKSFRERNGIPQDARPLATAAARLEEIGLLRRAEHGKRGGPSLWALTEAGLLNAKALERNRPC